MADPDDEEQLSLNDAASHLLEECRMVLPGIQALFGFQLIAVFNNRFSTALTDFERDVHLVATLLVAVAIALVMAPAAWHRRLEPRSVSARLIALSTRCLLASMFPLAFGIALEVYLIARIITGLEWLASAIAVCCLLTFFVLWFVFPGRRKRVGL